MELGHLRLDVNYAGQSFDHYTWKESQTKKLTGKLLQGKAGSLSGLLVLVTDSKKALQ